MYSPVVPVAWSELVVSEAFLLWCKNLSSTCLAKASSPTAGFLRAATSADQVGSGSTPLSHKVSILEKHLSTFLGLFSSITSRSVIFKPSSIPMSCQSRRASQISSRTSLKLSIVRRSETNRLITDHNNVMNYLMVIIALLQWEIFTWCKILWFLWIDWLLQK